MKAYLSQVKVIDSAKTRDFDTGMLLASPIQESPACLAEPVGHILLRSNRGRLAECLEVFLASKVLYILQHSKLVIAI